MINSKSSLLSITLHNQAIPEFQTTSQQQQQELTWQLKDTAYRAYFLSLVRILQFYLGQAFLRAFAVGKKKKTTHQQNQSCNSQPFLLFIQEENASNALLYVRGEGRMGHSIHFKQNPVNILLHSAFPLTSEKH